MGTFGKRGSVLVLTLAFNPQRPHTKFVFHEAQAITQGHGRNGTT